MFQDGITLNGWLAVFLPQSLLVTALMYFHFRARPTSLLMKLVTVVVALLMSTCATASVILLTIKYEEPLKKSILALVLGFVPIAYVAAIAAVTTIYVIDRMRLRVIALVSDPPDIFFGFYWTRSRIATTLVLLPVFIFALSAILVEIGTRLSTRSVITLRVRNSSTGPIQEIDTYEFVHPMFVRLNETSRVEVRAVLRKSGRNLSCGLSGPGFDIEQIKADPDKMTVYVNGQAVDLPDCFWLATARQKGSQTLVLAVSPVELVTGDTFNSDDSKDIESIIVVGEPFTIRSSLVALTIVFVLVGLLRIPTAGGERPSNTDLKEKSAPQESPKLKPKQESILYEGETRSK